MRGTKQSIELFLVFFVSELQDACVHDHDQPLAQDLEPHGLVRDHVRALALWQQ